VSGHAALPGRRTGRLQGLLTVVPATEINLGTRATSWAGLCCVAAAAPVPVPAAAAATVPVHSLHSARRVVPQQRKALRRRRRRDSVGVERLRGGRVLEVAVHEVAEADAAEECEQLALELILEPAPTKRKEKEK
jgi:hypothetical protein